MVYMSSPRTPLTIEQMFSSLLPKVEITKVTLEYDRLADTIGDPNTLEAIYNRNPHIDVRRGNFTQRQRVANAAEAVDDRQENINVTVNLQIKMQQGLNAFPTVLQEAVIRQAMKIQICWVTTPGLFDTIINSGRTRPTGLPGVEVQPWISFLDWQGSDGVPDFVTFEGAQKMEVYTYQETFQIPANHAGASNLGILAYAQLLPSELRRYLNTSIPEVNTSDSEFSNLVGPLENLWVLNNNVISSTIVEFVDKDNEVWKGQFFELAASEAFVLAGSSAAAPGTPERRLHDERRREILEHIAKVRRKGKYFGKPIMTPIGDQIFLKRRVIQIPKVQDFRIAHRIEKLSMDFSITEDDIFPNLKKDLRGERIKINAPKSNFSDIFLSRDIGNNCRFFFSVNWKRILLENSVFGKLFEEANQAELDNLVDSCSIKDLRIFRHRVGGSGEIGSKPTTKLFDENAIPALIVGSQDELITANPDKYKLVTGMNHRGGSFRDSIYEGAYRSWLVEKELFYSELVLARNVAPGVIPDKLRHFTGIDGFVKKETDGYYKYEAQLECFDKSIEIIDNKHNTLLSHINTLIHYYKEATRLGSRNSNNLMGTHGIAPWISPHIDTPGEQEYEPGQVQTGAFDPITGRFSNSFCGDWTNTPSRTLKDSLRQVIDNPNISNPGFIQILNFFGKKKTTATGNDALWGAAPFEDQIKNALLDYLNPYSATPESINIVLQLMQTVVSKIGSILGVVYEQMGVNLTTPENYNPADQKQKIAFKNRTFKVTKNSTSVFNANLTPDLGFDFLNTTDLTRYNTNAADGGRDWQYRDPWHHEQGPIQRNNEPASDPVPTGLYEISHAHFDQQAWLEKGKYFSNSVYDLAPLATNINGIQPWTSNRTFSTNTTDDTYFTPHTIVIPANPVTDQLGWANPPLRINTLNLFDIQDFLDGISRSLYGKPASLRRWLEAMIDGTGIQRLPLQWPLGSRGDNDWTRISLANDLASYFSLYHNVVIQNGASVMVPTDNFSSQPEGEQYYRGGRADELYYRCVAYPTLVETLEKVKFDSVTAVNEKRMPLKIGENRIEKLSSYDLAAPTSKIAMRFNELKAPDGNLMTEAEKLVVLAQAPNQIKALIWNFGGDGASATEPDRGFAQPFLDVVTPETSDHAVYKDVGPAFDCTTQIINRMEGLIAYRVDRIRGQVFLDDPVWAPFNSTSNGTPVNLLIAMKSAEARSMGQLSLLCRSVSYSDDRYLIRRNPNYDLPVYDEYFIMGAQ